MVRRRKTLMASRGGRGAGYYFRRILIPAVSAAAAGGFIYLWFFTGILTLQRINLYGRDGLMADSLTEITGRYIGKNIMTVGLDNLKAELMRNSDIAEVRFSKDYPHRLDCYLEERKPVAAVLCGGLVEVDESGVFLSERISKDEVDLPVITGLSALDDESGTRDLKKALEALRVFKEYGFSPAEQLSEIHIENEEVIFIWLDVGSVIRVGKEDIEERIRKLKSIYHLLDQKGRFPELVDLRFKHQVVVR